MGWKHIWTFLVQHIIHHGLMSLVTHPALPGLSPQWRNGPIVSIALDHHTTSSLELIGLPNGLDVLHRGRDGPETLRGTGENHAIQIRRTTSAFKRSNRRNSRGTQIFVALWNRLRCDEGTVPHSTGWSSFSLFSSTQLVESPSMVNLWLIIVPCLISGGWD